MEAEFDLLEWFQTYLLRAFGITVLDENVSREAVILSKEEVGLEKGDNLPDPLLFEMVVLEHNGETWRGVATWSDDGKELFSARIFRGENVIFELDL